MIHSFASCACLFEKRNFKFKKQTFHRSYTLTKDYLLRPFAFPHNDNAALSPRFELFHSLEHELSDCVGTYTN